MREPTVKRGNWNGAKENSENSASNLQDKVSPLKYQIENPSGEKNIIGNEHYKIDWESGHRQAFDLRRHQLTQSVKGCCEQ